MTRPRAADDFAVIRARIEELSREGGPAPTEPEARPLPPRPYHTASAVTPKVDPRRLPQAAKTLPVKTTLPKEPSSGDSQCITRPGNLVPITSRPTAAHFAPIDGRPLPFKLPYIG